MDQTRPREALGKLLATLDDDDPGQSSAAVDELVPTIAKAVDSSAAIALDALDRLRRKRQFPAMLRVAEAAFRAGVEHAKISRLYCQALIDEGLVGAALAVLAPLREKPGSEAPEIDGLIGRAHKQRYVDNPTAAQAGQHLDDAIEAYLTRYNADPAKYRWHGINAVALLARAERDGRSTGSGADWRVIARHLLAAIDSRPADGADAVWDAAIAAEAHVALGDFESAAGSLASYTRHAHADAFEFASTLRQLRQVWQIDEDDFPQRALVDLLEARLLRSKGGRLAVDPTKRANQLAHDAEYLEAVLGTDEYRTIQWYRAGLEASKSVVRIVYPMTGTLGTGFVLPGEALHPSWARQSLVVTNFHVANRNAVQPGRAPADLRVEFEDNGVEVPIRDILWESPHVAVGTNPPASVDTAVLQLDCDPHPPPSYQPSTGALPAVDRRVYVIGYPLGKALAFSLNDNKLLGTTEQLLHYRAPTAPGSSGSPVFDDEWRLIGLHHGGGTNVARLDDLDATYSANEGLVLGAVRALIKRDLG